MKLAEEKLILRPIRAESDQLANPKTIWEDSQSDLKLQILYPDMFANERARDAGDQNSTSTIVSLVCGSGCVLLPGDSTIHAWRELAQESQLLPIRADVIAMPHHGGLLGENQSDVDWFLSSAVNPDFAVLSVGTSNQYGHPRPEVTRSLRNAGVKILCTQITKQCSGDLESIRPGVLPILNPGNSSRVRDLTHSGRSRRVACAGTIVAELHKNGDVAVMREDLHRSEVVRKVSKPLCS